MASSQQWRGIFATYSEQIGQQPKHHEIYIKKKWPADAWPSLAALGISLCRKGRGLEAEGRKKEKEKHVLKRRPGKNWDSGILDPKEHLQIRPV